MKPWEETWTAEPHGNACECSSRITLDGQTGDDADLFYVNDGGRALAMGRRLVLAACAPELYRMLAKGVEGGFDVCIECGGINDKHHEGCALVALLKRARGETEAGT